METIIDIPIRKTTTSRLAETDFDNLEFGRYVSDHMFVADYSEGRWHAPHIVPFANLSMSPTSLALHYGQTVFEGMKAFRMKDGNINVFRLDKHYERFVRSLERMCMAVPSREMFDEGILRLVDVDRNWVPKEEGSALYLRPFIYASEAKFGIKVSEQYRFVIFTGPVSTLYKQSIRVKVETQFIRAARGGTGFAKCGGNYGGALFPTQKARQEGYEQVLWTDARENVYIEESGMMNVMFVIDNVIYTAPLSDSILDGITRDSLLTVARSAGYEVAEKAISISDLEKAFSNKTITEAFGAGTAAVVAPIKTIGIGGIDHEIPAYHKNSICYRLRNQLEAIRNGQAPDIYGWNFIV
jgi:branched-chain amino acid aminotransferase